jgi:hypothetical protein
VVEGCDPVLDRPPPSFGYPLDRQVEDKKRRLSDEIRAVSAKLDMSGPHTFDRRDVVHYCESIRERLEGLSEDFEAKQRILWPCW